MTETAVLGSAQSDFVERATDAFRHRLAELIGGSGLPEEAPESLGTRAGMAAAAAAVWTDHVGPFLDSEGVAELLDGVTKQAVSQRVRAGRLLALRTGSGRLVYPLWQFREGAVVAGLPEVLETAGYDPDRPSTGWTLASWLVTEDPDLGGQSPVAALAAGRIEPVLSAAREVSGEFGADELSTERADVA